MGSELGLAVVSGGTNVVDGDIVGGDEAREVEELVEVALGWQGHHDNYHLGLVLMVLVTVSHI